MKVTKNKIGNFGIFGSKGLKYIDQKRLRNKEIIIYKLLLFVNNCLCNYVIVCK